MNPNSTMPSMSGNMDNLFYSSSPQVNIPTAPTANYTTPFNMSGPMSQILGNIGKQLKPMDAYTQKTPYDQYAAPYRQTLQTWANTFAKPEFQQFTANPWERGYANNLASTGAGLMGSAKNDYTNAQNQMWQPYYNQVQNAQNSLEDTVRNFYNTGITQNYTGPTAFRSA
jgi:hypothetical protein